MPAILAMAMGPARQKDGLPDSMPVFTSDTAMKHSKTRTAIHVFLFMSFVFTPASPLQYKSHQFALSVSILSSRHIPGNVILKWKRHGISGCLGGNYMISVLHSLTDAGSSNCFHSGNDGCTGAPSWRASPKMREETSRANFIPWVTIIMVSPSPARARMTESTSPIMAGSRTDVGSSGMLPCSR